MKIKNNHKCLHCGHEFYTNQWLMTNPPQVKCPECNEFSNAVESRYASSDTSFSMLKNIKLFISFLEKYRESGLVEFGVFGFDYFLIVNSVVYEYFVGDDFNEKRITIKITESSNTRISLDDSTLYTQKVNEPLTLVWKNGDWLLDGPWVKVIEKQIQNMIDALNKHNEVNKKQVDSKNQKEDLNKNELLEKLINGWS